MPEKDSIHSANIFGHHWLCIKHYASWLVNTKPNVFIRLFPEEIHIGTAQAPQRLEEEREINKLPSHPKIPTWIMVQKPSQLSQRKAPTQRSLAEGVAPNASLPSQASNQRGKPKPNSASGTLRARQNLLSPEPSDPVTKSCK